MRAHVEEVLHDVVTTNGRAFDERQEAARRPAPVAPAGERTTPKPYDSPVFFDAPLWP